MLGSLTLPLSAHELRDAIRSARPFDAARLDRVLRHDAGRGLLEVQASTSWKTLASHLGVCDTEASAWENAGTVGQSVAENAPGPDGRPIIGHIDSLTLVTADGELRRVSRESSQELFSMVAGGQGIFGAVYSITLRLDGLIAAQRQATRAATLELPHADTRADRLELLVPPSALDASLAEVRACCAGWHTAITGVCVRPTQAENESTLRWARREYAWVSLALAARDTLGGSVRMTQLQRELVDIAISFDGSFPIACSPAATRAQVETCYPQLKSILAEKRRLDPAEKIVNPWYRHYRSLLAREACTVRWSNQAARP